MKQFKVTVPWREGLHLRPATRLVRAAQAFRSTVQLKCNGKIADLRSILSVITLCAGIGVSLDVVIEGDDEHLAAKSVEQIFQAEENDGTASSSPTR